MRKNLKFETYVTVSDVNNVVAFDDRVITLDGAMEEVKAKLRKGGTAVIDEFQRLRAVYLTVIAN
ncbi:hypothetical protein HS1genome_1788 [Sulfodiicoccus acidiphilus]|uniref:Uncharacterized protein n=1 Tax=Sulfodiicoccus acidiphilus TaxID=1670455 RepID=A0A348B5E7_9CREN|nr:hypothetical protein [Sulfodiicoccus acidiphilus]BBD73399.1 hypothetical protein HS1genome_1788 [Sulfodiicoccus acidiphilus]GGT98803.1 hypothetical protein GCM10007116_15270 [Sulfodiicoccus acidiphilus]